MRIKAEIIRLHVPLGCPNGQITGFVFVAASASSLSIFLGQLLNMFLLSSLTMVVIAFIVIYFVTARMVKPLRDMLAATQSFSRGDYTVRVQVNSGDEIGSWQMNSTIWPRRWPETRR